MEENRILEYQ